MVHLWAATPVVDRVDHEEEIRTVGLREVWANLQTDRSELDVQEYGRAVEELVKLRAEEPLPLEKGDHLYLEQPTAIPHGEGAQDWGLGDYVVEADQSGFTGERERTFPTVTARRRVKC